jgi:hypothetical protein
MSDDDQSSPELYDLKRAGLESRQADQDRTLIAAHRLEAALTAAAPGRQAAWVDEVQNALRLLQAAIAEEADDAERPDSLLSDIARTQPWLRNRVRGVRMQHKQIRDAIGSLNRELDEHPESAADFADVRQRLGWVLTALHHQRARESDLIYEAYYEAFRSDLAPGGGDPPA